MIRKATYSDIKDIESILTDVVDWMLKNNISNLWTHASVKWSALGLNYSIDDFYLYTINSKPVACMALTYIDKKYWASTPMGEALYLHKLAVKREYAGKGISKELIHYAFDLAKEKNIKLVRLDCNANRDKLRALYEGAGFRYIKLYEEDAEYRIALYQYSVS